ncbi:MAG: hypothetical protein PUE04_03440, partial [Lachnospira sp.]|nr:hypothetical protein [Lachnospira sp.]
LFSMASPHMYTEIINSQSSKAFQDILYQKYPDLRYQNGSSSFAVTPARHLHIFLIKKISYFSSKQHPAVSPKKGLHYNHLHQSVSDLKELRQSGIPILPQFIILIWFRFPL